MKFLFRRVGFVIFCSTALYGSAVAATAVMTQTELAGTSTQGPSLGLTLEPPAPSALLESTPSEADRSFLVRLTASWEDIEQQPGVYDWSALGPEINRLHEAGYRIGLCLTGPNSLYLTEGRLPSPLEGESLDAWLSFVRSAVRSFAGQVSVYQIWDRPARLAEGTGEPAHDPGIYAFLLKQSALAVRAEARAAGVEVAVAQGALEAGMLPWQQELWEKDTAAYVDVLPLHVALDDTAANLENVLATIYAEAVQHPPAPAIWVYLQPTTGASPYAALKAAIRALASGASLAVATLPADPELREQAARWAVGTHRTLAAGFASAPLGDLELRDARGRAVPGARALGRFLSDRDFTSLIVYDASAAAGDLEQARLIVDSRLVRNARTLDPITSRQLRTAAKPIAGEEGKRALRVPVQEYPMLMLFQKAAASPGFELPPEELEVETTRGLTAEEIIARYQQVQKIQDDALESWMAQGRIDFHFKLAQGGSTIDVSIDSNYFWERGGRLEWEQTDYYINGNRVRWKKIPELPLIQPEKVITLPLDLTLDKTYFYRLAGENRVGGREAYVLAFQPVDPEAPRSLYRGRVWIDKQSFERLKVSLVQTRMEPPVLSNEERDLFRPHQGPGGKTYWLLSEIDGQQIWTAGGRNFIVRREVSFASFEINPPRSQFEERRSRAYASSNQMLRDTDQGFRYLERQEDGTRKVKDTVDSSQLFAAAGAFRDQSRSLTPLAGVNYFNYDVAGRNVQMNVLFAGVLAFFTASKPDLFGGSVDATADASATAVKFDDKLFVGDDESELERVETRPQNFSLRLGIPLGKFFKVNLVGDLTRRDYFLTDKAEGQLGNVSGATFEYRLPQDHVETAAAVELEFNRRGYTVAADGSWASRSDWEEFGLFDVGAGSFVRYTGGSVSDPANYVATQPEPVHESFRRWRVTAFKEWYLPKFQKVRGEINYVDGADLDRFSRYEFSFFGDDRLNGFSGSGVRFDQGLIARGGYSFNLFEVIRLDTALETAWVEEEDSLVGRQSFTGFGLSGNVVGPWKTVISLNYGIAVASDIPALEREQEFLLLVFKLF